MGAIEHEAYLKFKAIPFDSIRQIMVRTTSAGSGGVIEFRRGSVDGKLLGSVQIEVNGSWEDFQEKVVDIQATTGRDDLYLVFKNEKKTGGLMNIDAIELR